MATTEQAGARGPAARAAGIAHGAAFQDWMRAVAARTEVALAAAIDACAAVPESLAAGMRHAVLEGGKRVRPALVHAAGEVSRADARVLDAAACAVEFVHAYSLVHDDLPCMDNDVLRRGKPTVHVAFGEATAMLVGDALQALAFEVLASTGSRAAPMVLELARAAGAAGMVGGQAIDLAAVGAKLDLAALEDMHRRKTGAMLRASVRMGALAGEPPAAGELAALDAYARAVGLAFQVVDDILDVEGDASAIGKTAGKDSAHGKPTYVSLLGLSESKQLAAQLRERALRALAPLGARAGRLEELAGLIVNRSA